MDLPPDIETSEEMPDALYWLLIVEKWGFPVSGAYLEQPWHFMQDLEAAMMGRARMEEVKAANVRLKERQRLKT